MGVRLRLAGGLLAVYDGASGDKLFGADETDAARIAAEEQVARERSMAEQQATLSLAERVAADQRATAAETEVLRLREELARLRGEGSL